MFLIFYMLTPPLLTLILFSIILILSRRNETNLLSESTPFECGMDPKSNSRAPFSVRFFLLAVLFLVFDVETVLLLALPSIFQLPIISMAIIGLFIIILGAGLIHECREMTLSWAK